MNEVVVVIAQLLARSLGYVRDRVVTGRFGATQQTDEFYFAFAIALYVASLVPQAVRPVVVEARMRGGKVASSTFIWLVAVSFVVAFGAALLVVGDRAGGRTFAFAAAWTAAGLVVGEVSLAHSWRVPRAELVVASGGLPLGAVLGAAAGRSLEAIAVGSAVGASCSALALVWRASGDRRAASMVVKPSWRLFRTMVVVVALARVSSVVDRAFAAGMDTGALTVFELSDRVVSVLAGVLTAYAAYVYLPQLRAGKGIDVRLLRRAAELGLACFVLAQVAASAVGLLFPGLSQAESSEVAASVRLFALMLPPTAVGAILLAHYQVNDARRTVVLSSTLFAGSNVVFDLLLRGWGPRGLALASGIASSLSLVPLVHRAWADKAMSQVMAPNGEPR